MSSISSRTPRRSLLLKTRRHFLKRSAVAASALAVPYFVPRSVLGSPGKPGANDRVSVGIIGFGTRGNQLVGYAPQNMLTITAICDVNLPRAKKGAAQLNAVAHQDFRSLLDRKDIDGVMVATPDHWHALPTICACMAGKDVYCEKPLSLTIKEGRAMVAAARKHDRVVQVGSQQRSMRSNRFGCELIANGRAGKIRTVIGNNYPSPWTNRFNGQSVPKGLNWDTWCGQIEPFPYHENLYACRSLPGWASEQSVCGGEMCNWGSHGLDQVQWALGMDHTGPVQVYCEQGPVPQFEYLAPESRDRIHNVYLKEQRYPVVYRYANGVELRLADGPRGGAVFVGDKGSITIDRNKYKVNGKSVETHGLQPDERHLIGGEGGVPGHIANWIECIKTRAMPIADIEIGHRTVTLCHLGNIARWTGRRLSWDPAKEIFPDDREANAYLERPRRKGFDLPELS